MGGMRKIAAILASDVVGYSRLAGADEDRTLSRLRGLRSDLIDPAIDAHHGRIVKRTGDGSLMSFAAWSTRCAARSKCRAALSSAIPVCRRSACCSIGGLDRVAGRA
jgi:class 3 adenylate cyclase